MDSHQTLLNFPVWGMLIFTVGVLFIAFEGGFLLGRNRFNRKSKEQDSLVGPMVAAILGLLAFMLSFSFGVAASHFDTRRHLVLDEANAIRTAYAMTGLLAESPRAESQKLLREYVNIRADSIQSWEKLREMLARSNKIQGRLWAIAMDGEARNVGASSSWLYAQCLTDMFAMQDKRVFYGTHGKIQPAIWIVLFGLAAGGMAAMGYHAGLVGMRSFFVYYVLILTFSLVMVLIYDLDRPLQQLFKVEQHAMLDLQKRMDGPMHK